MLSILEAHYAHVVDRLLKVWGSPIEFGDVFNDLLFDTRTNRSGWPADAWEELQFLEKLHKLAYETKTDEVVEQVADDIKWV